MERKIVFAVCNLEGEYQGLLVLSERDVICQQDVNPIDPDGVSVVYYYNPKTRKQENYYYIDCETLNG